MLIYILYQQGTELFKVVSELFLSFKRKSFLPEGLYIGLFV